MARILIGWELGAGRGHLVSMLSMAGALTARGHQVALAVQRFDALPAALPLVSIFQAPIWPGLLADHAVGEWRRAATMIDILARLGMDRPRTLKHMIAGWDAIFAAFATELVIGDYAPALLLGAQGRLPSIATGPGFQVPPEVDPVPRLGGGEPGYDEAELLDIVDADLRECGRPALDHLGAFFRHSRSVIASFHELDPFGRDPSEVFCAPALGSFTHPADAPGDEVFVYANGPLQRTEALWKGLAGSGLRVRVHLPVADTALAAMIESHGIIVEREPVPWPLIAARSRIAVNHGAHGTMCALMLAGIPQLALAPDMEKQLHARAMARHGFGVCLDPNAITPEQLSHAVRALHADADRAAAVRAAATALHRRMHPSFEDTLCDAVDALLQA